MGSGRAAPRSCTVLVARCLADGASFPSACESPGAVAVGEARGPYVVSRMRRDIWLAKRGTHGGGHPPEAEGLSAPTDSGCSLDDDRMAEIEATFGRIHRPLRWPMENFRRRYISNKSFVGYRFTRIPRHAHARFSFGVALRDEVYPGVSDPPEVLAYAFVEPKGATLYHDLVTRKGSAFRRLSCLR